MLRDVVGWRGASAGSSYRDASGLPVSRLQRVSSCRTRNCNGAVGPPRNTKAAIMKITQLAEDNIRLESNLDLGTSPPLLPLSRNREVEVHLQWGGPRLLRRRVRMLAGRPPRRDQ